MTAPISSSSLPLHSSSSDETTPLLPTAAAAAASEGVARRRTNSSSSSRETARVDQKQQPLPQDSRQRRVTILLALLTISLVISQALLITAETRVFEMIYCRQYYGEKITPGEGLCKVHEVERRVSTLRGGQQFFTNLPALVLAFPVGLLADRYGRKWLLVINMVSLVIRAVWAYTVCSFPDVIPLKLVWLEAAFALLGGGLMVSAALMFTMLTDVTQEAERASAFFLIGAADQLGSVLGPFISAAAMQRGAWTTFSVGVLVQTLAIPIALCLPETLPGESATLSLQGHASDRCNDESGSTDGLGTIKSGKLVKFVQHTVAGVKTNTRFLFADWRVALMAFFYPFRMFTNSLDVQLLQYIPRRYGLSIATAALFQSIQAIFSCLALLVLLPALSAYLLRSVSPNQKDVLFSRVGFAFQGLSWLIIGLAPHSGLLLGGLIVGALAAGTGAAIRATVTHWVRAQEIARLNSILGILECLGLIVAGPVVAGLYNAGISIADKAWNSPDSASGRHGGGMNSVALGLPWLVSAGLSFLVTLVIWNVNWKRPDPGYSEASASDSEIFGEDYSHHGQIESRF